MGMRRASFVILATFITTAISQQNAPSLLPKDRQEGFALVVFLRGDCPCNEECVPLLNGLQKQLGRGLPLVGLVDSEPKPFVKQFPFKFPIYKISDQKLVKESGAINSLDIGLAQDGQILHVWPGFSRKIIEASFKMIDSRGGKAPTIDLQKLPRYRKSGCPLDGE
jgi:hypothetical protein